MPNEMNEEQRGKNTHIDEKIDALIEWNRKYPRAEISKIGSMEILKEYSSSDEDYKKLQEEFEKMREYYTYIRNRRSNGGLPNERFERARNGNVRGIFGDSDDTLMLAKKYRINTWKINYICRKYGSIENFLKVNQKGQIDEQDISCLRDNLTDIIDISNTKNKGYNMLYRLIAQRDNIDLINRDLQVVDYCELKSYLDKLLAPRELQVIIKRFGLESGECDTLREIGKEWDCSFQAILGLETRAIEKLRQSDILKKISKNRGYCLDQVRRNIIENRIYNSNAIFIPDEEYKDEPCDITVQEYRKIVGESSKIKIQDISSLELSVRSYNCLMRAGIDTIEKLLNANEYTLRRVRNLGDKCFAEVLTQKEEIEKSLGISEQNRQNSPIETLGFSGRVYNGLMRNGIDTVEKLINADIEELLKFKYIGQRGIDEILRKKEEIIKARENSHSKAIAEENNVAEFGNQSENMTENQVAKDDEGKTELEVLNEENERLLKQVHELEAQKRAVEKLSESIEK